MSDEELDALIDRAKNLDSTTANTENTGGISTFALPKNLTNELEAIYNAGVNIKSQIQKLYSMMPTTNGDLRDQITEVSNFVMRQDRWIVLRIDALASVVAEHKTRIDTNYSRATDIHDYAITNRSRISSLDNQLQPLKSTVAAINDYAVTNRARISSLDVQLQDEKAYSEANRGRITALDRRLTPLEEFSEANRGRINTLDGRLTANEIYSETNRGRITTLDGRLTANEIYSETNRGRITTLDLTTIGLTANAISQGNDISTLFSMVQNPDLSLFSNLFGVNTISSTQSSSDGVFTKLVKHLNTETKGQLVLLRDTLNAVKTSIDKINTNLIDEIKAQLVMVRNNITALNANQLLNTAAVKTFADDFQSNFTTLLIGIEGLQNVVKESAYDDSSLQNLIKQRFIDYFSADYTSFESGATSGDGNFTRLVKGQFTRLINELRVNLNNSFANAATNISGFKEYLREEFALLNDWFSLIVEWLDMIYTKPSAVFEGTVFDYDRLQEILDGISFGNVVNEAGTNLWDVLQQLVDSLGGLLESIVNVVPDLIDRLIGLIIPDDPNYFSNKIESIKLTFDSKFGNIISIGESVKLVFGTTKPLSGFSITVLDYEIELIPQVLIDYLPTIRKFASGFLYLFTFVAIYKRFVGEGDVIS